MTFSVPDLSTLITQAETDLGARLGGPVLRQSALAALARVQSAGVHGLYGYQQWQARQILPDMSDPEILERQAGMYGLTYLDAQPATGALWVTGSVGALIEAGTQWQDASGTVLEADVDVTLTGTETTVAVTAVEPGVAGNVAAGVAVTLISPVVGVQASAVVAVPGLSGGAERETLESLRERLLLRLRQPPQGGAKADYIAWAQAAHPDVDRVWVTEELGPGTVSVRFSAKEAAGGPIPAAGLVAAVDDYIATVRPVCAEVYVLAPEAAPVNFSIQLSPNTAAVRAAVDTALRDLIRREAVPGGTLLISHIREAISSAAGENDHTLTVPAGNVVTGVGQLPVMGTITWL